MKIPASWVPFRVLAIGARPRRITPALVIISGLVLASCDGSPVAELDPPEDDPIPVMLEVWSYPDSVKGILSPITVYVRVRTPDGELVPDHEITWRAQEGEVGRWEMSCRNVCPIWERSTEVSQPTDERGETRMEWILGPEVGEQEIQITAPGAEPVMHRIHAVPGVVLVGLFTLHDEEAQANLPSDSMRIHATNYRAYAGDFFGVRPILDAFDEGATVHLVGWTKRGAGFDPLWNFHLGPSSVTRGAFGTVWSCWVVPDFTEEWMDQILGDSFSAWWSPCSGVLRLVGVEEVPASYLAGLASEAVGRQ